MTYFQNYIMGFFSYGELSRLDSLLDSRHG